MYWHTILQTVSKSGYMWKLGGQKNNKWQKRHFTISFSNQTNCFSLQYKLSDKDKTLKGAIFLPWAQVEEVYSKSYPASIWNFKRDLQILDEHCGRAHCFQVTPRLTEKKMKPHYFLSASSQHEMQVWDGKRIISILLFTTFLLRSGLMQSLPPPHTFLPLKTSYKEVYCVWSMIQRTSDHRKNYW